MAETDADGDAGTFGRGLPCGICQRKFIEALARGSNTYWGLGRRGVACGPAGPSARRLAPSGRRAKVLSICPILLLRLKPRPRSTGIRLRMVQNRQLEAVD